MIKILGVCGSARKASTYAVVERALEVVKGLAPEKIETTLLALGEKKINPCIGCNVCKKKGVTNCQIYRDDMTDLFEDFHNYDAYIIATPVYDYGITPQLAAYFSRFRSGIPEANADRDYFLDKPLAALAVGGTRNGGQEHAIDIIHGFGHTLGMPIVNGGYGVYAGACVWSQDKMRQGVLEDEKGMDNIEKVAERLAKLTLMLHCEEQNLL